MKQAGELGLGTRHPAARGSFVPLARPGRKPPIVPERRRPSLHCGSTRRTCRGAVLRYHGA